jgi:NodT family efflux transporter outer membrane factor (OMF) lipoprotein
MRPLSPLPPRAAGAALALAAATLLAGCVVGPDFAAPVPPTFTQVTTTRLPATTVSAATMGGAAQHLDVGRDIEGEWWTMFHSPRIAALVAQALKGNPSIAAAQATLRQAKENTRAEQGGFFPSLSASASAEREKVSAGSAGQSVDSSIAPLSVVGASLSVSYNPDIFGGVRRTVEQLGAQAEYEQFELEATYLSLAANVVTAALNEASLQGQIDATNEIIRIYRDELAVTQRRLDLGGVTRADVLTQQSNLAAALATLPPLLKQRDQQHNQLADYLGAAPSQIGGAPLDLATLILPEDLPVSLPSAIVAQRPDIRAAEATLHAATANVGIATANMLPNITLSGSYGAQNNSFGNLFTPAGLIWSVAGAISQPIFEGGTLAARRRAAVAAMDVAAAQYSSTVNAAFQDVANALVAVQRDAGTLRATLDSERTAATSLAVVRGQYAAGSITYVNVLQAEQLYQSARLSLVSAQAARFTDTVALMQALGGGWWHRADIDPSVAACCGIFK